MDDSTILNRFLVRYFADMERGDPPALEHYQDLFPGHADLIEREHQRLQSDSAQQPEVARIGDYTLRRTLGRGGQGVVYLAEDPRLGRLVALKVLPGTVSRETLARFQREARITSRLDDAGICTVYETGLADDAPFIAMRFVPGESLARELERARTEADGLDLPADEVSGAEDPARGHLHRLVRFIERTARSLHAAHEAGVVHRDIKPGNIMVSPDGPVILDFGLARAKDENLATLTRAGDVFGTPAYMSPEQISGDGAAIDRRADVYALGVVLYECLTLHRPFEAPTREALYEAIRVGDPPIRTRWNRRSRATSRRSPRSRSRRMRIAATALPRTSPRTCADGARASRCSPSHRAGCTGSASSRSATAVSSSRRQRCSSPSRSASSAPASAWCGRTLRQRRHGPSRSPRKRRGRSSNGC